MPEWYEPHVRALSLRATAQTVLWFRNSKIGWATVHPVIERYGWRYIHANIWEKGLGHIAGKVNTKKIRRFQVVSESCVQYVFEPRIDGKLLMRWLLHEWNRTGLPIREANQACRVANGAVRKYLDQGHVKVLDASGEVSDAGRLRKRERKSTRKAVFSQDGERPMTAADWVRTRLPFDCPQGATNVWSRPPLRIEERIKVNGSNGKAVNLDPKLLDLTTTMIKAATTKNSAVWEPFGGLFSASLAARHLGKRSIGAEIEARHFHYGMNRVAKESLRNIDTASVKGV